MPNLTSDAIEHELSTLQDPWISAAFAVRVATFILPGLAQGVDAGKPFLWFFKELGDKHQEEQLLDILRTWQFAYTVTWFRDADVASKYPRHLISIRSMTARQTRESSIIARQVRGNYLVKTSVASEILLAVDAAAETAILAARASNAIGPATAAAAAAAAAARVVKHASVFLTNTAKTADLDRIACAIRATKANQLVARYADTIYAPIAKKDAITTNAAKAARKAAMAADRARLATEDCAAISDAISALMQAIQEGCLSAQLLLFPLEPFLQRKQALWLRQLRKLCNGFDYWADWYQDRSAAKPLEGQAIRHSILLSREILARPPGDINAYLKSLQNKTATGPLNRVRAIFIGFGAAGKTSVIRVLNGEEVIEGKEEMTPGVEIREWKLPGSEITADLWDFGGQVIAHATHQFFLRSRCLYVLVLDGRAEINANEQAEYWLEHVRAFGQDSPVLIVGNKADQARVNLDMSYFYFVTLNSGAIFI